MEGLCGSFFWDLNVTWYTDTLPRFTNCFENTVLIWVPCLLLWGFTPLQLYYIAKSKSKLILWNLFNKVKLMITALLIGLVIFRAVYSFAFKPPYFLLTDFVTPLVQMSTFVLAIYLMLKNRKAGIRSSGVLFMFWLLLLIGGIPPYVNILRGVHYERYEQVIFITDVIYFPLVVSMCILNSFADSRPLMTYFPQPQNPCPDNDAPFISKILFAWFEPLVWKGYRNPLDFKDLWSLSYENTSAYIVPIFDKYWKRETGKVLKVDDAQIQLKNGVKPGEAVNTETTVPSKTAPSVSSDGQTRFASVILPICLTFLPNFFLGAILKVFMDLLTFASPQILRLLINYVEGDEPFWRGIFYAALLFFVSVIQTLFLSQYFHQMFIAGMRMRSALISTIFRKALCISNVVRRDFTLGEIVNLMSVDTQRLADLTAYINMLWSAPLQIILALIFLWQILGPSVLAGLAVMVILIPVNALIASKMRSLQISQMKNKDNRIKLMNEILSGIKILKLYAWEPSFERQIDRVRKKEIQILKTQAYLNSATSFIWACAPFLVSLVTFAVYVLSSEKNILDAETAFVSLSLFNILRFPLSMLPMLISNIVQASVSVKRINKFLNSPELNPFAVSHDTNEKDPLVIEDGSFTWGEEGSTPFLNNINIRIKSGSLVAVVGSVGSGKSSLISAFLGEIHKVSGYINTKGSLAYVPQQAWIQNATLRSNITFGGTLNQILYDQIISACALQHDLDILPGGDQTEIGEKGINLSGGQKQRISLARAVYNDADVYFLDDPLSAVDSHVGKHIFEHVIGPNGILKNKTRLLVTHSITYLSEMDLIIVLKNGTVSEMGTYRELLDKKGDFADFLLLYLEDNKVENEEDMNKLKELLGSSPQLEEKLMRQISKGSVEGSTTSLNSLKPKAVIEDEPVKVPSVVKGQRLIEEEKRETGNIRWQVYSYYLSSIGLLLVLATIVTMLFFQSFSVLSSMWLSTWSSDKDAVVNNVQDINKRNLYLSVYALLGLGQAVCTVLGSLTLFLGVIRASSSLHILILKRVLRWPMLLFDITPIGRIITRFSYDVDVLDNTLGQNLRQVLNTVGSVCATIFIISYSTPAFLCVIVPIGILYYFIQRFYVATSRQLKRLESISRSPIYSHFGEAVSGVQSIRAYGLQSQFIIESEKRLDYNQMCFYPGIVSNRWLSVRLETIGNLIIFFAAFFGVLGRGTLTPGLVGLSITYALQVTQTLNWLVRMASEVETNIVAVERIKEYSESPQEAPWDIPSKTVPQTWPDKGEIVFQDYKLRYREGLDLVLKGINFRIEGQEKIGIVGRTGAGKSSLTLAIFRIIEAAGGKIIIDGVDISTIGLHALRSRLTIIPQDPILFSGTLRINLDPLEEHSDDSIWHALELSHLKEYVTTLPSGLQFEVTEGGENFSAGQRQLICLARALLRKTKILVLDEATAAVDLETDDFIQSTIRREFSDCTFLTIAHRLNTIMDYDRIIVLDQGQLVEFDTPAALLKSKGSVFYSMASDAGLV